jgi:hypothetical protein
MKACNTAMIVLFLIGATAPAPAFYDWHWGVPEWQTSPPNGVLLTDRCGSKATAECMSKDRQNVSHKYSFTAYQEDITNDIWVARSVDGNRPNMETQPDPDCPGFCVCAAISQDEFWDESRIHVLWRSTDDEVRYCDAAFDNNEDDWPIQATLDDGMTDSAFALGTGITKNTSWVYACYRADPTEDGRTDGVWFRWSHDKGANWHETDVVQISEDPADQIALAGPLLDQTGWVFVAYHYVDGSTHKIALWKSTERKGTLPIFHDSSSCL